MSTAAGFEIRAAFFGTYVTPRPFMGLF